MLYQKARILEHAPILPEARGREVWIQAVAPQNTTTVGIYSHVTEQHDVYYSHLRITKDDTDVVLFPEDVELLPEFREDAPQIELDDWLKEDSCPT